MTRRDLLSAVARATGEDIDTISLIGFTQLRRGPFERDVPAVVDWDEVDAERGVAVLPQRSCRTRGLA